MCAVDPTIDLEADDRGGGRYTLLVAERAIGELDFRMHDGRRVITHTGIRGDHEGRGLAGRLTRRMLDDARAEGLWIVPLCSYVRHYLGKHPEDQDLVDQDLLAQLHP